MLSPDDFRRDYEEPNRPVVLTDAASRYVAATRHFPYGEKRKVHFAGRKRVENSEIEKNEHGGIREGHSGEDTNP